MDPFDAAHLIAGTNLALGTLALALLGWRIVARQGEMPREVKLLHLLAINLLIGLLIVSSSLFVSANGSFALAGAVFAIKSTALIILWQTRDTLYRTGDRFVAQTDAEVRRSRLPRRRNKDADHPDREISA